MTDPENRTASPWLPNLVGGISIWKLARDLNEPQFFDGRLLVPETEGTDALPTTVRWDVTGLVPLPEARTKYPTEVEAAIRDFLARLEKVGSEFANEASGYHKFKQAFTVPGLDADGGAYYFYDERAKKLCLINWGASPRSIAGQQEFIFGWGNFGKLVETAGALGAASAAAAAAAGTAAAAPALAPQAVGPDAKKDEKKKEEDKKKKPVAVGRPWWHWLLVVLAILGLLALLLFLFRDCNNPVVDYPEGGGTKADGSPDGETGADGASETGAAADATGDALADATTDGGGGGDAGDASKDGASDAGDAGPDGSKDGASDAPSDAKADAKTAGGSGAGGVPQPGGGILIPGGPLTKVAHWTELPHQFSFEPRAVHWRVTAGQSQLDPTSPLEWDGPNFGVVLKPDGELDKVKVEWQDEGGRWHQ